MPQVVTSLSEAVHDAARAALEDMFFMVVFGASEAAPLGTEVVSARVDFSGGASGYLSIAVSRPAAAEAAANFLGEDAGAVGEEQLNSVVAELANILCGSALSRWQHDGRFVLSSPVVGDFVEGDGTIAKCALELEEGFLWFSLVLHGCVSVG
jgi:chemotaxis protein CheY-P-specific phosphatase CheC